MGGYGAVRLGSLRRVRRWHWSSSLLLARRGARALRAAIDDEERDRMKPRT